jgi:hypothetical protein
MLPCSVVNCVRGVCIRRRKVEKVRIVRIQESGPWLKSFLQLHKASSLKSRHS